MAIEEEQKAEVIVVAHEYVNTLGTIVVGGHSYTVLFHDSSVDHVCDQETPILISR